MRRREVLRAIALSALLVFLLECVRRLAARFAETERPRSRRDAPLDRPSDPLEACATCGLASLPEESARFLRLFAEWEA